MRIEQVRLQAFGPYVEQQVIDFTQLQSHLFLIRGETGAGKTAILDAITYALYGHSSGGDRGEFETMRSRMASDKTMTYVECIFCIQQHRYRFYRQIEVHKKRNDELVLKTKIDAGELLEDGFHPFFENNKQRMIEEKAQQLIGLSHAQFIQVMMLPQGKFEQLLISSSEAKQEILKSLFHVEKWADICEQLSEKAKFEKDHLEQIHLQIQMLLQQSKVETIEDFDHTLQALQEQYHEQNAKTKEASQRYQDALKHLQIQTQYHALRDRFVACEKESEQLRLQKDDMDKQASLIQMYQQYVQIKPYVDAMTQSKHRCEERKLQIQKVIKQEQSLMEEQQTLLEEAHLLEPKKVELAAMKDAYPALLEEHERFMQREQLTHSYHEIQKHFQDEQTQLFKIQKQQEAIQCEQSEIVDENKSIEKFLETYPEVLKQEQRYAIGLLQHLQVLHLYEQIEKQEQGLQERKNQFHISEEHTKSLEEEHERRYQHFLDHSADLLAQSLIEGQPCPVCGATHHPSHTHVEVEKDVLSSLRACKQALVEASEQTQKLHEEIQVEGSRIQALQQQRTSLLKELSERLPNGYDEGKHKALQDACKKGETYTQRRFDNLRKIEEIAKKLQLIEQQQTQLKETSKVDEQKLAVIQSKLDERKQNPLFQDMKQLEAYIQTQKDSINTYEQQISKNVQKTLDTSQAYAIVLSTLKTAKKEYEEEQRLYETAKVNYELQHVDLPQDIKWDEIDIVNISLQVKQYERRCVEVKSVLQQLTSQLEHTTLEDIELVQKQVEETQTFYQENAKDLAHYEHEIKILQTSEEAVRKLQKKWELALGTYEQLNSFVKSMRGDNRIGIERYVLGVMLSQITQVANQLLHKIHHGRYQIYRSDETSGRVRKFGLELSIYDTYSCSQRSVVSLSGGEKFLVSLALSLALSTVVQARSGGIYLETMFVDEGFGSLDEQSIADALQVLSSMGQSKAMIGIISHVELLKENIPYGIQVHKKRNGSSLTMLY